MEQNHAAGGYAVGGLDTTGAQPSGKENKYRTHGGLRQK
ncbi:hypothetical protein BN2497_13435 [Janthinobacterium sp. CG23_2]|nr:hypothetical protein BN2497_13435 [Janthinobacterium sp. CG23_2]CUU33115.1 hypothetical protein BN3177_13435 [Janthinobacterium sp. CG23_2]